MFCLAARASAIRRRRRGFREKARAESAQIQRFWAVFCTTKKVPDQRSKYHDGVGTHAERVPVRFAREPAQQKHLSDRTVTGGDYRRQFYGSTCRLNDTLALGHARSDPPIGESQ